MVDDIRRWLEDLGLGKYGDLFAENEVGLRDLPGITYDDLKELDLPLGPRRRILMAIETLDEPSLAAAAASDTASQETAAPTPHAERRHLTVMFCDLVGSTVLSQQLDPEDLRDVMSAYQDAVSASLARFGGHVAKYLGDGVLAYFGWPQAYEDQAERAVRAGLDAVLAVNAVAVDGGQGLRARIGIASGEVVVGDLVGESGRDAEAVTGETPNLAARLQGVAAPDQVVIDATTQQLVGQAFVLEALDPADLKGFAEPVPAWRVARASTAESRFEAAHSDALTGLIGRSHEVGLLQERWRQAMAGEGQVVVLSGEAGIGKSLLLQALRGHLTNTPHYRLRYQCSPHHNNIAFYPIIQRLERAAGFAAHDGVESRLDKLETLLRLSSSDIDTDAPLLAALLSLAYEDRYDVLELAPQQQRDRTIEALITQILNLSRTRPILFLLEDAHWIDPTTETLIGEIMARIAEAPVFMLITHRPDYSPPWADLPHRTGVALNRLSRDHSKEIVKAMGGHVLGADVIDRVIDRADGIPLYVEELTKSLLESGDSEGTIPASLQASLIARLDRLGEAKEIAQIGAAIGREFSFEMIQAIHGNALGPALERLVQSELVFQRGRDTAARYIFKHALVQDAAYASMLNRRRRDLHRRIAETIVERFPAQMEQSPSQLARHFEAAGDLVEAATYSYRAGSRLQNMSANHEAIAHYEHAIALIASLPEPDRHAGLSLDCHISLGTVLLWTKGAADPAVTEINDRAIALADTVNDDRRTFQATWAKWFVQHIGAHDPSAAVGTAERLLDIGQRQNDRGLLLQAHHSAWTSRWAREDLHEALEHAESGIRLHDVREHGHQHAEFGGHDAGMCCRAISGMISSFLGRLDRAAEFARDSVVVAQQIDHTFSEVFARGFGTTTFLMRREMDPLIAWVEDLEAVAGDAIGPLRLFVATPRMIKGWAYVSMGRVTEGMALLEDNFDTLQKIGFPKVGFQLMVLADAKRMTGDYDSVLDLLAQAEANSTKVKERIWLSEVSRVRANALVARDEPDAANDAFAEALATAKAQGATLFELRAARDFAHWQSTQSRTEEALQLLQPIYRRFTEGLDTPDLIESRELLDSLT
jgi:class 3 adenylate cyclase/tetratricopeptide (TPR) repeat protein